VSQSFKVSKDKFEAVIKALLNTPPMPATEITGKRHRRADAKKAEETALGAFMCHYERSYF
jgi:hypothetical protein